MKRYFLKIMLVVKKMICKTVKIILVGLLCLVVLFCIWSAVISVTHDRAEASAIKMFDDNREAFVSALNLLYEAPPPEDNIFHYGQLKRIPAPKPLEALGFEEVLDCEQYVVFNFEDHLLGVVGHGFIYTPDSDQVESWYRLMPLDDHWYYYRA